MKTLMNVLPPFVDAASNAIVFPSGDQSACSAPGVSSLNGIFVICLSPLPSGLIVKSWLL